MRGLMLPPSPSAVRSEQGSELPPAFSLSLAQLLAQLGTGEAGLSGEEATRRAARYGLNQFDERQGSGLLCAYLARLRNPLVLVLMAAAGASALTGDLPSLIIILVILAMSITLDVVQEHRALTAALRLREQVSLTACALRDAKWTDVPARQLVPGDVIRVSAGDLVPADCRLLEAHDLYVNEALLTGEAYPAEKILGNDAGGALLPRNAIFMGSSVLSGSAIALVAATGRAAQLGNIAMALRKPAPDTAFELGIRDFGRMILRLTLLLVLFALLINLAFHRPPLQSLLFSLALAVGLTPELLPMVISVTLAHGALRLSRKGVIVKRLTAMHDLGAMDILCSDKTGTLTEARISLTAAVDWQGVSDPAVLKAGILNARFETGLKSPIDDAILAAAKDNHGDWNKIDEAPFDFERRRVCVLVDGEGVRRLIVKGAPEDVLALCEDCAGPEVTQLASAQNRQRARDTIQALEQKGHRVIGIAAKDVDRNRQSAVLGDDDRLIFLGCLAFADPPKAGVDVTLAALRALGVSVKIVTGDGELVTRHVCEALGMSIEGCLTGQELAGLSDEALAARLDRTNLFCRMTPPQKSRLVAAYRRKGHVVGYLGDGINDAPSLHAADVGFSVDTGVDVAKEAASMILLKKTLDAIVEGVREGRRTYANILKYIMMGTSSNFGNMFSMAGGALLLPFLPMLPIQILLNNLLYDISEVAIPLDHVEDALLARPRRWDIGLVRKFMLLLGPVSSLFDFVTFALLLLVFRAAEPVFHAAWFVESMATQVLVIFIIRSAHPWRNRPHPALIASSAAAIVIATALPFTRLGNRLGLAPLPISMLAALFGITAVYLAIVYVARRWFFSKYPVF